MVMPPRKYFTEITLVLHTRNAVAITPDQLKAGLLISTEQQEMFDLCHIYVIAKRASLSFDPDDFSYDTFKSKGSLIRKIKGKLEHIYFEFPMKNRAGGDVKVGEYPHRKLIGFDIDGVEQVFWPASLIAMRGATSCDVINDFEVLYVGQAFGDGKRTALERLKSHSTLQSILADLHVTEPDSEVMLFMFEYVPATVQLMMDGIGKDAEINGDEDFAHLQNVLDRPPSEKEQISIAEAGLIWYFQPSYNINLKNAKPNDELKLLNSCYSLDFSGLVVEISTEEFPCRLWSQAVSPGYHHIAQFDLHSPEERRVFFSLPDGDGGLKTFNISGPAY